ncbi:cathepsin W isoform X2 [Notamacropus eugenii]|uniref:cathepsin W isoform X2 n=1 Tax=Notamacropus eugenii TaxID=9315 RepID=UPI003B681571
MMLPTKLSYLLGLLAMVGLPWNTYSALEQSFHDLPPVTWDIVEQFKAFQIQYNKSYPDPAEQKRRLEIFVDNLAWAQQLTKEHGGMAQFGVTQFSDLTEEEFRQLYQPWWPSSSDPRLKMEKHSRLQRLRTRSCDWRKAGVLNPVRDQKTCNCCWAISAVENVEALWAIQYHKNVVLSVQGGLAKERDYPYRAQLSHNGCQKRKKEAWIHDFLVLPREENYMAQHLVEKGPITVTINMKLLQNYQKGVIKPDRNCDPQHVDHSVLLVGFGHIHNFTYWTLKNSWGSNWGEKGYFRLHRGSNACGITKYPVTALVAGQSQGRRIRCNG